MNAEELKHLFHDIAPAQALQIRPVDYAGGRLVLAAPLAPNLNDKGTGFAGSISSILALAGWGAITLLLRDAGVDGDVLLVKSEIDYLKPVQSGLRAEAEIPAAERERVLADLRERRRSRVCIQARLSSDETECATMTAHYALIQPSTFPRSACSSP